MDLGNIGQYEAKWGSTKATVAPGTTITTHTVLVLAASFANAGVKPIIPDEVEQNTTAQGGSAPDYWNRRTDGAGHITAQWNWGYGVARDSNGVIVQPLAVPNKI